MKRQESLDFIQEAFDRVIERFEDTNDNEFSVNIHSEEEGVDILKIHVKLM